MNLLFKKNFYNYMYILLERLIYIDVSDCLGVGFCMEIFGKIVRRIWIKLKVELSLMLRKLKVIEVILDMFKVEL